MNSRPPWSRTRCTQPDSAHALADVGFAQRPAGVRAVAVQRTAGWRCIGRSGALRRFFASAMARCPSHDLSEVDARKSTASPGVSRLASRVEATKRLATCCARLAKCCAWVTDARPIIAYKKSNGFPAIRVLEFQVMLGFSLVGRGFSRAIGLLGRRACMVWLAIGRRRGQRSHRAASRRPARDTGQHARKAGEPSPHRVR